MGHIKMSIRSDVKELRAKLPDLTIREALESLTECPLARLEDLARSLFLPLQDNEKTRLTTENNKRIITM